MIPYQIRSGIGRILFNKIPYYMSNETLNWMKFKYYPIVNWTQETFSSGKFEQYGLNATSFDEWRLFISITKQFLYPRIFKIQLTPQRSSIYFNHKDEEGWILVDIKQAGKYIYCN